MSPKTPARPAALNATAPVALGAAPFDVLEAEAALPFAVEEPVFAVVEPVPVAPAPVVVVTFPVVAPVVASVIVAPQLGTVKVDVPESVPSALAISAECASYHDKMAES
jgi:hypothetical protein